MNLELIHTRSFSNQQVWNNFKYIDYKHTGPKRSYSNRQVWINSRHIDPMYLELIHTRLFSIQQVWKKL